MKVWTGYFGNLKKYREAGLFPIGIAVSPPQWWQDGVHYKALGPTGDMLRLGKENYTKRFLGILAKLDQEKVLGDLMDLSGGRDIVLLCYESLKNPNDPEEWCHRQMVATWLEQYGIEVREWRGAEVIAKESQESLF